MADDFIKQGRKEWWLHDDSYGYHTYNRKQRKKAKQIMTRYARRTLKHELNNANTNDDCNK